MARCRCGSVPAVTVLLVAVAAACGLAREVAAPPPARRARSSSPSPPRAELPPPSAAETPGQEQLRGAFSPRMDYDEWTPLGRGDPLKNDPTYDYVPPVLDHVHYWIDPYYRMPQPAIPKPVAEVAASDRVKGAAAAATAAEATAPAAGAAGAHAAADSRRDALDPILKLVTGPKLSSAHRHQLHSHLHLAHHHHYHHHHRPLAGQAVTQQRKPNTPLSNAYIAAPASPLHQKHQVTSTLAAMNTANKIQNLTQKIPSVILEPPPIKIVESAPEHVGTTEISIETEGTLLPILPVPDLSIPTTSGVIMDEANLVFKTTLTEKAEEKKQTLKTVAGNSNPSTSLRIEGSHSKNELSHGVAEVGKENPLTRLGFLQALLAAEKIQIQEQENSVSATKLPTTRRPERVTTSDATLTTDPIFSHYRQPAEPLRGPMYLIIQGHSKVKTYGANKYQDSFHGIPIATKRRYNDNEILSQNGEGNETERNGREVNYGLNSEGQHWPHPKKNRIVESGQYRNLENGQAIQDSEVYTMSNPKHLYLGASSQMKALYEYTKNVQGNRESLSSYTSDVFHKKRRKRRQLFLEDFIPIDDSTAEEIIQDFFEQQGQASGVGSLI